MQTKTFLFNKLGRDKAYEKMLQNSVQIVARELRPDEKAEHFKLKLVEEANEVSAASTPAELVEELADALEVIHGFAKVLGLSIEDIEKIRVEKREAKGGFDRCIFVERVTYDESSPFYAYLLANPEQYPEIIE
jgi:predicted house-cleaning noncanonical NTP pyrophosphatase (MazG superfamily)